MKAVRVSLSSGEDFYVDAPLEDVAAAVNKVGLHQLGSRFVNGDQVAQLVVAECPTIFTPETLEEKEEVPA